MRIVHVSPSYFHSSSYVGGGERYAVELARAMADRVPTTLVSFGSRRETVAIGSLEVQVYPAKMLRGRLDQPLNASFLREMLDASVIHCHHLGTPSTVLALLAARALKRRSFVTPEGLLPSVTQNLLIQLARPSHVLCLSQYSAERVTVEAPISVIFGGVDPLRFGPHSARKEHKVVYVGRLLPHKGLNYLIEALEPDMRLEIYGRAYDDRYFHDLRRLAAGKNVTFLTDASDDVIATAYASSLVSVLPSVNLDMYNRWYPEPELLGLVLLEAMASGTAVIGTRVGAIPEIIEDGVTGFLVPPNDPASLKVALKRLFADPALAEDMGRRGCDAVRERFTWTAVAERCLAIYG